jgi:hypothetical protein
VVVIRLPDRPTTTLPDLQRDVVDVVQQFGPAADAVLIRDVAVGTAETPIAHGRGTTPVGVFVMPQSDARVWRSSPSDLDRVFLTASASVIVDVLVLT